MKTIVLCPGHHPHKPGAVNKNFGISENQVAVPIVNTAAAALNAVGHTVHVVSGTLREKVQKINEIEPDIAIDLHFNADPETDDTDDLRGYGCMVMHHPKSHKRKKQADAMSRVIAHDLNTRDLGGRKGYYWGGSKPGTQPDYFLAKTTCPAFIPEPGYIDNNNFAKIFLTTPEGQQHVAVALVHGIQTVLDLL